MIESSALEEVRDEFYVDLEEVTRARDSKGTAVAFGVGFSFTGLAVAFEDFADGEGGRDFFVALVEEELTESHGSQVSFFPQGHDSAAEGFFDVVVWVVRPAGAIEEGRAIPFGLGKSILPFVEGLARDSQTAAS